MERTFLTGLLGILLAVLFLCSINAYAQEVNGFLTTDWEYKPNTFINKIYVDDLNGDGVYEVIASSRDGVVYDLLKKKIGHTNWQYVLKGDVKALKIMDFDGDGKKEVLVGTDKMGLSVRLIDWQGGNKGGSTIEYDSAVYDLDAADIDGDGKKDIIIGAQGKSVDVLQSGEKKLWEYATNGPVYYVHGSDIDVDGKNEVVAASRWNENEEDYAEVYAIDSKGKNKWTYGVTGGIFLAAVSPVAVYDINGDGKEEVLVGSKTHGLDVLGPDGALLWNYRTEKLVNVVYVSTDKDSPVILLGATPYVYALDGSGALLWRYPVATTVFAINTADLDSDDSPEVLLGANQYVHVLSADGKKIYSLKYDGDARSIAAGDVNGDGGNEVAAGFGWAEARLDANYFFGNIAVYTVNKDYTATVSTEQEKPQEKTSTTTRTKTSSTNKASTTTASAGTTVTVKKEETSTTTPTEEGKQNNGQTMVLIAGLGVGGLILFIVLAVIVILVLKKKSGGKKQPPENKA